MPGADSDALAAGPEDKRVLLVAGTSSTKRVAGSVAHTARKGDPPALAAIGASSINAAVKSLAVARQYVAQDGFDLIVKPAANKAVGPNAVMLHVRKSSAPAASAAALQADTLRCGNASQPSKVAGAIAGRVREAKRVCIVGIGADAVRNMVQSVIRARGYLAEEGFDLSMKPRFVHVDEEGEEDAEGGRTAVRLDLLAEQV